MRYARSVINEISNENRIYSRNDGLVITVGRLRRRRQWREPTEHSYADACINLHFHFSHGGAD